MTKVFDTATDLITFARGSSGTALRRVGYGDELVTNGDFTSSDGWSLKDNTNISGGQLTIDTTIDGSFYSNAKREDITITAGKLYQWEIDIESKSPSDDLWIYIGGGGFLNSAIRVAGTGVIRGFHVAQYSTSEFKIEDRHSTNATHVINSISVKEVIFDRATDPLVLFNHPDDTPRIEYGSDGSLKGLLIEEQRTNLVTYSEDINTSFASQTGASIEPAVTTQGPILAAQRMVADTSTGFHRAAGTALVQNSTDYTFSCFFKADGQDVCGLGVYTGTSFVARASFDLSTVQETVSNGSATIKSVGGDWYHCAVTGTTTGTTATVYIYVNSLFSATAGDGTSGLYVYGAQLEEGSFATSYIPTSGSQSTRWADVASIPVSAFGYNQEAGTWLMEWDTVDTGNVQAKYVLSSGSNARVMYKNVGPPAFHAYDGLALSTYTQPTAITFDGSHIKAAYAEDDGGSSVAHTGVLGTGSGAADLLPNYNPTYDWSIGNLNNNANFLNGHIKSLSYYPRRLTDAQLQELTA